MKFHEKTTVEGLKKEGIPTFNECEHYLLEPKPNTMQTIVIALDGGKFMTVNINPVSDNVDVKVHGEHNYNYFGVGVTGEHKEGKDSEIIHAFYNMNGKYNK